MEAAWAKLHEEADEPEPAEKPEEAEADPAEEEPEAAESEPEQPQKPVEAPSELPKAVRDAWGQLPEEARNAVLESQRDMSRKLSEQGRLVQGIKPIQESLVKAVQELPALADMRPQDVAQEVFQLAKISADFQTRPVETVMQLVRQHGLEKPLMQALQGQQPEQGNMRENALLQKISQLERNLQQVSDPDYIRSNVEQVTTQHQMMSEVEKFASTADHWSDVEAEMPRYIQAVQAMSPNASPGDVLRDAYDLAVSKLVPEDLRAKPKAAEEAAQPVDPARTEAGKKAKSVNVTSKPSGQPKPKTQRQIMEETWQRLKA